MTGSLATQKVEGTAAGHLLQMVILKALKELAWTARSHCQERTCACGSQESSLVMSGGENPCYGEKRCERTGLSDFPLCAEDVWCSHSASKKTGLLLDALSVLHGRFSFFSFVPASRLKLGKICRSKNRIMQAEHSELLGSKN